MNYQINGDKFGALPNDGKIEFATDWFLTFHVDPVHEMPWVDGEYHFPYGGPYDASDEINIHFEGLLDDDQIMQIVEEVEADGLFEWAPSLQHPDQLRAYEEYQIEEHNWLLKTSLHYETNHALWELESFLDTQDKIQVGSLPLRMSFIQCWSILEAYLSNTLIKAAQNNQTVFENLSVGLSAFKDEKFSAEQLAQNSNLPLEKLIIHLKHTLFHAPKRIGGYPQIAFGEFKEIGLNTRLDLKVFDSFLAIRHDCVHRNGKSLQDAPCKLTIEEVRQMINAVKSYTEKVEQLASKFMNPEETENSTEALI